MMATYAIASWVVALAVSPLENQAVRLSSAYSDRMLGEEPSTTAGPVGTRTVAAASESLSPDDAADPGMSRGADGGRGFAKGGFNQMMVERERLVGIMRAITAAPYHAQIKKMDQYKATQAQLAHLETEMGIPRTIADARHRLQVTQSAASDDNVKYQADFNHSKLELDAAHAQGHAIPTGEYKKYIVNAGHSADQQVLSADENNRLRTNEKMQRLNEQNAQKDSVESKLNFQFSSEGAARPTAAFVDNTDHSIADVPGPPRKISANYIGTHSATFTWMAPENNRALLTGYSITGRPVGSGSAFKLLASADSGINHIMKKVRKLQGGIRYEVKLQALYVPIQIREMSMQKLQEQMQLHGKGSFEQYAQGDKNKLMIELAQILGTNSGPFSEITTFTTHAAAPDSPTNVIASAMAYQRHGKDLECVLQWTAPASNGATITGYRILQMRGDDAWGWGEVVSNTASNETRHVVPGLEVGGYEYFFRVYAINSQGRSKRSKQNAGIVTLHARVPAAPQELIPNNMLCKDALCNFDLTWKEPSGRGGTITGYRILQRIAQRGQYIPKVEHTGSLKTNIVLDQLLPGTHYAFKIAAESEIGMGRFSQIVETTTPAGIPSAPKKPVWGNVTGKSITLSWKEPTDNGAPITGYRILYQQAGAGGFFVRIGDTQSTDVAQVVTGLTTGGVSYEFQVSAINSAGMGPASPTTEPVQTAYSEAAAAETSVAKAAAVWKANHVLYAARQLRAKWLVTKERLIDMTKRFRIANELAQKSQHHVQQLQGQNELDKELSSQRLSDERVISNKKLENKEESAHHWARIRTALNARRLSDTQELANVRILAERREHRKVQKSKDEMIEDLRDVITHIKMKLTLTKDEVKTLKHKLHSRRTRLMEAGPTAETILGQMPQVIIN